MTNHKVIEEIKDGNISLRVVQPDPDNWQSRKYWLQASFGHLELGITELDSLEKVLQEFHMRHKQSLYSKFKQELIRMIYVR